MIAKPTTHMRYLHMQNRNGKGFKARHLELSGFVKVDRRSGEWAYYEFQGKDGEVMRERTIVTSKNWADHMDTFRPDHLPVTHEWKQKIELRMRGMH